MDANKTASYSGSGIKWNDLSGNGYHFTMLNNPTFETHNGLGSFKLSANNDMFYYYGEYRSEHNFGNEGTIQITYTSINNQGMGRCSRLVSMNNGANVKNDYTDYLAIASCDQSKHGIWAALGIAGVYPTSSIQNPTDKWKNLAFTWKKGSKLKVYVDGNLEPSINIDGSIPVEHIQRTHIGASSALTNATSENSNFRITNIMLFNRELSESEISRNSNVLNPLNP